MQADLPNGVQRVRRRFSLLDEIAATYKLFQIVVVRVLLEMIAKILALLLKNVGHLFVDLLEQLIDLRQLLQSRSLESMTHLIASFLTQSFSAILGQNASLGQVFLYALDGARELGEMLFPLLHLFFIAIALREITCRVVTHSIRDGLDQNWSLLSQDQLTCLFCSMVDGNQVVAVDADGGHPVGDTSDSDTIASVLLINRR